MFWLYLEMLFSGGKVVTREREAPEQLASVDREDVYFELYVFNWSNASKKCRAMSVRL